MGASHSAVSLETFLLNSKELQDLANEKPLEENDVRWEVLDKFLAKPLPLGAYQTNVSFLTSIDRVADKFCGQLVAHQSLHHNIGLFTIRTATALRRFHRQHLEVDQSSLISSSSSLSPFLSSSSSSLPSSHFLSSVTSLQNALFMLRFVTKHFIENRSPSPSPLSSSKSTPLLHIPPLSPSNSPLPSSTSTFSFSSSSSAIPTMTPTPTHLLPLPPSVSTPSFTSPTTNGGPLLVDLSNFFYSPELDCLSRFFGGDISISSLPPSERSLVSTEEQKSVGLYLLKVIIDAFIHLDTRHPPNGLKVDVLEGLQLELLNLLLVLTSTQLFRPLDNDVPSDTLLPPNLFLDLMMDHSQLLRANEFIQALLLHFLDDNWSRPPSSSSSSSASSSTSSSSSPSFSASSSSSSSSGTKRSLFGALLAPISYLLTRGNSNFSAIIADRSLLLILVLSYHYSIANPYKNALLSVQDVEFDLSSSSGVDCGVRISFSKLFDKMSSTVLDDNGGILLLLYLLLQGGSLYLTYLLARMDLDTLVVPMLHLLYKAGDQVPQQIYMIQIILLILSQDPSFNKNIQKLKLSSIDWFKERLLASVSLSDLIILVLLRAIQLNVSKIGEKIFCFATLVNLASYLDGIHYYSANRLVKVFELVTKKYTLVVSSLARKDTPSESPSVYQECVHYILQAINSCLFHGLPQNPQLVYALLHQRTLFETFRCHPRSHLLLSNILAVLEFFNKQLESSPIKEWSADSVFDVVMRGTLTWKNDIMKKMDDMQYLYHEEQNPEDFFLPYLWNIVISNTGNVPWDEKQIKLFTIIPPSSSSTATSSLLSSASNVT